MKALDTHAFSSTNCARQLDEFRDLLRDNRELGEKQLMQFFRKRRDLAAFVGSANPRLDRYDRLAFEYDLFGDFACDIVVGDWARKSFVLVEFEDAKKNSLFVKRSTQARAWAPRFERGHSQVIDWFWKLHDMRTTDDFRQRFGGREAAFAGLLVIGRSEHLSDGEKARLRWRQDHVVIDSRAISVVTFDELCEDLNARSTRYSTGILSRSSRIVRSPLHVNNKNRKPRRRFPPFAALAAALPSPSSPGTTPPRRPRRLRRPPRATLRSTTRSKHGHRWTRWVRRGQTLRRCCGSAGGIQPGAHYLRTCTKTPASGVASSPIQNSSNRNGASPRP